MSFGGCSSCLPVGSTNETGGSGPLPGARGELLDMPRPAAGGVHERARREGALAEREEEALELADAGVGVVPPEGTLPHEPVGEDAPGDARRAERVEDRGRAERRLPRAHHAVRRARVEVIAV